MDTFAGCLTVSHCCAYALLTIPDLNYPVYFEHLPGNVPCHPLSAGPSLLLQRLRRGLF